ncbi:MAG: hypothetical protein AAFQ94_31620 [Bacteroidota bacterium]
MKIQEVIQKRRTTKVLGNDPWPLPKAEVDHKVYEIIQSAEMAPFHYQAHKTYQDNNSLSSIVPWRVYWLKAAECRKLANYIQENDIKAGKILQMLFAADALLQVTWLPDPSEEASELSVFEGNLRNMEHIAAGSAAIQNMLLTATALNIPNYWSSGGVLRTDALYAKLGINSKEILLGSVFLFPEGADVAGDHKVGLGGLRDKKGAINQWSEVISL